VPKRFQNEKALADLFNAFPGGVSHVTLARNPGDAVSMFEARNNAALSVEAAECSYILSGSRSGTMLPLPIPIPGLNDSEDAIKYTRARLLELDRALKEARRTGEYEVLPSAFIVFRSQRGAQLAAQAVTAAQPLRMSERWMNVHPDDVIWDNLNVVGIHRWWRRAVSLAACTGLIIWWSIITTFVNGLANLSTLVKYLKFLADDDGQPLPVLGPLQGIIPPMAMALLMMILTFILRRLTLFEGVPLNTAVQMSLLHKYHFFQVVNVLIVSTFASGITNSIQAIIDNPSSIINILASKMPAASNFFITYLLLQGFTGAAKEMLMVVPFVLKWFKNRVLVKTPRAIWENKSMPTFEWGTSLPPHTLAFGIGVTYCVIAPVTQPFVLFYFIFYYVVYRYQFLYVYDQPDETEMGGRAFPVIVSHIFSTLYISEVTMIGIFLLKQSIAPPILLLILLLITVIANIYVEKAYPELLTFVPLEVLLKADRKQPVAEVTVVGIVEKVRMLLDQLGQKTVIKARLDDHTFGQDEEMSSIDKEKIALLDQAGGVDLVKVPRTHYLHPALHRPGTLIWLPEDAKGVAKTECEELISMGIAATTEGAFVRENGRVGLAPDESPLHDETEAHLRIIREHGLESDFNSSNRTSTSDLRDRIIYNVDPTTETVTNTRVERGPNGEEVYVEETITTTTGYRRI
jgi:hypothetical protein